MKKNLKNTARGMFWACVFAGMVMSTNFIVTHEREFCWHNMIPLSLLFPFFILLSFRKDASQLDRDKSILAANNLETPFTINFIHLYCN